MILDEKIKINISNSNIRFFRDKYSCKSGDIIDIFVKDLNPKSNFKINCSCDICDEVKCIKYQAYNLNIEKYGFYSCSVKCSQIKKKKTCIERYGVDNPMKDENIKEKYKSSIKEKYGVDNLFKNKDIIEKIKKTNTKIYGCCSPLQNDTIFNKVKETNIEKYGKPHPLQNKEILEKMKSTNIKRWGCEYTFQNDSIRSKIKNNVFERWGCEYTFQNEEIKEKILKTNLEKYGVRNPSQNEEIFKKIQKSSFKKFNYENISYQGSYEKDFLDNFYSKTEIKEGLVFDYFFKNKSRKYFSDFYLPEYNLIIEIKSKYTYNLELLQNLKKQKSAILDGYNFLFIIDKDYSKLRKFI